MERISTKLDVSDNKKITNITHLINLQILDISDNCGIDNNGILLLTNLTYLNNTKITNITHLINLKEINM
jgi:hypothetical protein